MIHFILLAQKAIETLKHRGAQAPDWGRVGDQALIDAILNGDQQAATWFVKRHWGPMIRVASGMLRQESVAMEVVQEAFETVFRELPSFRGESSLKNWMYRIMVNRARRVGSREAKVVPFSSLARQDGTDDSWSKEDEFTALGRWKSPVHGWRMIDPQNEAINREGIALLAKALNTLPEAQKVVVTMRDVEGLSSKDVCELLDLSEANQRVLLHRGRQTLRLALQRAEEGREGAR